MKRLAVLGFVALLLAATAACGGDQAAQEPSPAAAPQEIAPEDTLPRGGTLRVATAAPFPDLRETYLSPDGAADYTLDPHVTFDPMSWEGSSFAAACYGR